MEQLLQELSQHLTLRFSVHVCARMRAHIHIYVEINLNYTNIYSNFNLGTQMLSSLNILALTIVLARAAWLTLLGHPLKECLFRHLCSCFVFNRKIFDI